MKDKKNIIKNHKLGCTFRPVRGLPEQVDLLDGWGSVGRVGLTDRHQQPLETFQNFFGKLVLLGGTSIQLLQLGWRGKEQIIDPDTVRKL